MSVVAICVNPMSGRDVRRLAAKASDVSPKNKQDVVARIALGADAAGAKHILLNREPFRIAEQAVSDIKLNARVELLKTPLKHTAADTEAAVNAFLNAGARTIVSLGGDGTNRAIVRTLFARQAEDVQLIPLSAGTNNAFPSLAEPTTAGMTGALAAQGAFEGLIKRCKVIHIRLPNGKFDVGLIDAAILADDNVGNLLPFEAGKIRRLLLTQADPTVAGMASIGGLLQIIESDDDQGLLLEMGHSGGALELLSPVSPGLFEPVFVKRFEKTALEQEIRFSGTGVLALDGDRDHSLKDGMKVTATIRRDGPWVLDTNTAIQKIIRTKGLRQATSPLVRRT